MKKLLLCIICSVMASCLIHTAIFFTYKITETIKEKQIAKQVYEEGDVEDLTALDSAEEENNTISTNSESNNTESTNTNSSYSETNTPYSVEANLEEERDALDLTATLSKGNTYNYDENYQYYYRGKKVDAPPPDPILPEYFEYDIPVGIMIGAIIYIIFIKKAKGKALILNTLVAFITIFVVHFILSILNMMIIDKIPISEVMVTDNAVGELNIWEILRLGAIVEEVQIDYKFYPLLIFPMFFVIIYVVNFVKQKVLVKELNKKLKERTSKE